MIHDYLRIYEKTNMDTYEKQLLAFAEKAHKQGLLSLEPEIVPLEDPLLKKGLHLMVDGTDPRIIFQILSEYGQAEYHFLSQWLRAMIVGPLIIQSGYNPHIVQDRLIHVFGYTNPVIQNLIDQYKKFSEEARRNGLFSLEDELKTIPDMFMKLGLQLVIDGTDPEYILSILTTKSDKLLMECKQCQSYILFGLRLLQAGEHPKKVKRYLDLSKNDLGIIMDAQSTVEREVNYALPKPAFDKILDQPVTVSSFEDIMLLDDRSIQKILREIDTNVLAISLRQVTNEFMNKIFMNMSNRGIALLKEDMEFMGAIQQKDIENAQQGILSIVMKLGEMGEIAIISASK